MVAACGAARCLWLPVIDVSSLLCVLQGDDWLGVLLRHSRCWFAGSKTVLKAAGGEYSFGDAVQQYLEFVSAPRIEVTLAQHELKI